MYTNYQSRLSGYRTSNSSSIDDILSLLHRMQAKNTIAQRTTVLNTENEDKTDPCKKYLVSSVLIKKDGYGLEKKIKKFKRTIFDKLKNVKDLQVYTSKIYPIIFIKYREGQKFALPKYKHLREIFKEIPNMRDKRQLIDSIFQRLFLKIDKGYFGLSAFALDRASDVKMKMQKGDIFNLQQGKQVMFYYLKNEDSNTVKFTLFDKSMRTVQFDSEYIQNRKRQHPEAYKIYQKFMKNVFQQDKQFQMNDIFDNQELQSEQEDREQQKMTSYELKMKIEEIISKDLKSVEEEIQSIEEEIETASENKQSVKILTQKRNDLEQNKKNFEETKNQVINFMKRQSFYGQNSTKLFSICLKKMIIAEKQLESNLPIIAKKRKILQLLSRQNLVIIEGQTGSGKSTQLPQILCEYYKLLQKQQAKPVLVTQPRRLATRTLAERVAKQMGENVGNFVDYVASANKNANKDAKIIFKLDRLVLDEITEDPLLSRYSCLVIDQAHQRTISMDVLLGLVKELLTKRKDFKVIVTSASMDINLFQRYFNTRTFKVSGRVHPITITHKDYQKYKEGDKYQMMHKIRRVIDEEILFDRSSMKNQFRGHLLCFCSSVEEINQLVKIYSEKLNKNVFSVYALHGKISTQDQKKVFQESGKHKFIFASRIAETAITIDGVRVVIDPGQDNELVYDQKYKVSSIKLQQITQSSAKQRAGRSGRTGPGHCFRLYSQDNFKQKKKNNIPQIQNSSLQTAVLRLKTINVKDVINFPYISKPNQEGLKNSLNILVMIGALKDEKFNYQATQIGRLLVKMPIEPILGRAIIQSMLFEKAFSQLKKKISISKEQINIVQSYGVKKTTIEILSLVLNFSSLFLIKKQEQQKGQQAKFNEFTDQDGDFFFLMNIYNKYKSLKQSQLSKNSKNSKYQKNKSELSKWISNNYLNVRALVEAQKLAKQIIYVSQRFFINELVFKRQLDRVKQKLQLCQSFKQIILSSLLTSFCPNLCKYSGNPLIGYTMIAQKRPLYIHNGSTLQLLGINAEWIICFDLYTNDGGRLFCKVAHQVKYDFLSKHLNQYVWNKCNIEDIQKFNPFYQELSFDLPTKIIQQIRFDYQKCEGNQKLAFLSQTFPIFIEDKNKVIFFLLVDQNNKIYPIELIKKMLQQYINSIKNEALTRYQHHFIGNIFIEFDNGLNINAINFKQSTVCVQIITITIMAEHLYNACSQYGKIAIVQLTSFQQQKYQKMYPNLRYEFQKIKVLPHKQSDKKDLLEYLSYITRKYSQIPIIPRQFLISQISKTQHSRAYIHFFAGRCMYKNTMFMKYDTRKNHSLAFEMLDMIKNAQIRRNKSSNIRFIPSSMRVSKKKNGINLFDHNFDEFQLMDQLNRLVKDKLLPPSFVYPRSITKFRDPDQDQARKSDNEWRQQIYRMLEKIQIKRQNLIVNISGFYSASKRQPGGQKGLRVNMRAEIFSNDNEDFDQIKSAFEGKRIIGCDKMHVKVYHDQVLAFVSKKVFEALEDQYYNIVERYKAQYPTLNFITTTIMVRNIPKIQILSRSQTRENLIKLQRQITQLFTHKIIKLDPSQYRFLQKLQNGQAILEDIEHEYNYKIYFGFEKFHKFLKVYCKAHQQKNIEFQLRARIKQHKYCSQNISYKGKNLNLVRDILHKYSQNIRKQIIMTYQIIFQKREIHITTNVDTFDKIKTQIQQIAQNQHGQCQICSDIMKNPYKFMDCQCSFCWQCIIDHIQNFRNSMFKVVLCPKDGCKTPINIYDIKAILSQQEFQKICELKIKQYVQEHRQKYYSCRICDHIVNKAQTELNGQLNCEVCGGNQCFKCGQSHPNYTCKQWKDMNFLTDNALMSLGIKKCKSCGQGIQKNGGCRHITCIRCKAHICWLCEKIFASQKQCYDHLANIHQGIFDPNTRE